MRGLRSPAFAVLAFAGACVGAPAPTSVELPGADTLAASADELLAHPVDLSVDPHGRVYVLDGMMSRVVRFETGTPPRVIGRSGAGPGEFSTPERLVVEADTLRVDDRGNGRVQVLTADGDYVRSVVLATTGPGGAAFGRRGDIALATMGISATRLVTVLDAEGFPRQGVGELVVPPVSGWDLTAMKADARRRRVPAALRNSVQPVLGDGGSTWLVLLAEGEVRRYDEAGRLLWTRRLASPEISEIRRKFFARNLAETRPFAFHPLSYVADAVPVGEELWLLINTSGAEPSILLVLDADGRIARRLILSDVVGARSLAVDRGRERLYLGVPSSAALLSVPLAPGGTAAAARPRAGR